MTRFVCIELSECRTPADDRPLGKSGEFLSGSYGQLDVAEFVSPDAAHAAAQKARRRRGASLWISGHRARMSA